MTDRGQSLKSNLQKPLLQVQKEVESLLGLLARGGAGSGHHGHAGRPGEVGGSLPSGEKSNLFVNDPRFPRPVGWTPEGFKKEKKRLVNYMAATYPAAPGVTTASWMAPDGTIYDVGRGGHQRSAINAFTKSGLWSEDQARASYHLGFHGPNEFVEYGFVRMYALNDANEFGFEMSSPDELTDAQRERLATEALKAYASGWRVVAGHSDRRLDLRRRYSEEDIRNLLGIVERGGPGSGHHGHAGRPGKVGGSQPGKGTGLGEFDFGSPSSRNDIRFSIDTMRALREGLNEEQIEAMRQQFTEEVEISLTEMESALGFPIEGLIITNSLFEYMAHQGSRGLDNPNMREELMSIVREKSVNWSGAYTNSLVWLDDTPSSFGKAISMYSTSFHNTVYHEVGHYLTTGKGSKSGLSREFKGWIRNTSEIQPSDWYNNYVALVYGDDEYRLRSEYRADLVASKVYNATRVSYVPKEPHWSRFNIGLGRMYPVDVANMNSLYSRLVSDFQKKYPEAGITERAEEEKTVLVLFPAAGEILPVPVSSLDKLPPKAIILDQIFTK